MTFSRYPALTPEDVTSPVLVSRQPLKPMDGFLLFSFSLSSSSFFSFSFVLSRCVLFSHEYHNSVLFPLFCFASTLVG